MKKLFLTAVLCFVSCVLCPKIYAQDIPNPKTADANAFVSNPDEILSSTTVNQLNEQLYNLEQETSAEVAVVAVNSIDYQDIADFANTLFNSWGIGKKEKDNGVLILFVLDAREIRFEIGYGLEGILPDAICKRIQTIKMIPEFKNGNYDEGILAGVSSVVEIIKNDGKITDKSLKKSWFPNITGWLIFYAILLLFSMIYMINGAKKIKNDSNLKTNRDRHFAMQKKHSNCVGGIILMVFFSFFFGIFILAMEIMSFSSFIIFVISSITIIPAAFFAKRRANKFRKQTIFCDVCKQKMILLDEQKDDEYLNEKQCFEEYIKSVDYDVFLCKNCDKNIIFAYEKELYKKCPECETKAYSSIKKEIVVRPTTLSSGKEQETFCCKFCKFTDVKYNILPRYTSSSGGYGGSSGGGRSSGGSFGGGRSGGGGSTSRW